jgi:hypothetical protein
MWQELKEDKEDWVDDWLEMPAETQFGAKLESMGCTGFGTNNIYELIAKAQYGLNWNLSDRFINKVSGTTRQGNTVDAPIDAMRKFGFLFEDEYPWNRDTFSWDDYYSTVPANKLKLAKTRLNDWEFKHEYVPIGNKEAIMNALKTSPLGGTVYAWQKNADSIYYSGGNRPNHYTVVILGYVKGKYWICGDSYPEDFQYNDNPQPSEFIKKLDWNFQFGCIKRYALIKKNNKLTLINILKKIARDIHGGFWFLKDGSKAKITDWKSMLGAIVDEIGVEKNNLTDKQLSEYSDYPFFGKNDVPSGF